MVRQDEVLVSTWTNSSAVLVASILMDCAVIPIGKQHTISINNTIFAYFITKQIYYKSHFKELTEKEYLNYFAVNFSVNLLEILSQ